MIETPSYVLLKLPSKDVQTLQAWKFLIFSFGGGNSGLLGSGSAYPIDPDPIRIRAGLFSQQEDDFALLCCGSSTGQTRIVGSRFDFRSGSDLKYCGHTQIRTTLWHKDESHGFFTTNVTACQTEVFPIFFRSCSNTLIIFIFKMNNKCFKLTLLTILKFFSTYVFQHEEPVFGPGSVDLNDGTKDPEMVCLREHEYWNKYSSFAPICYISDHSDIRKRGYCNILTLCSKFYVRKTV